MGTREGENVLRIAVLGCNLSQAVMSLKGIDLRDRAGSVTDTEQSHACGWLQQLSLQKRVLPLLSCNSQLE